MNWEEQLDRYGKLIDERLEEFLSRLVEEERSHHPFMGELYPKIREYVLRKGKRLASCSTLLTYKGYAGEPDDRILDVCVGVELFRHSILIHDDLVDQDELRRGGKAFHKLFSEARDERFGEGTAIFVGNAMYALALQVFRGSKFPEKEISKITRLFEDGYRAVNESQVLDLLFEYEEPDVEEWQTMASERAAALFRTTILAGAILGGAPERDLRLLKEAATHIGYAFDIQDDIIDTFASEEQYGRPPGGDLMHGKKPLHVVHALKLAGGEDLKTLKEIVGKKSLTREELEAVRNTIRGSGALDAAKDESQKHAETAKELVAETSLDNETKNFFSSFISYTERSLDWYK
ncbi:MAG: polyprenyl synthetase family protein [Candidatus Hadarchaeota archaeon]|nr:polyprenyl synthetase family protein [Candidatus Hadarchaeota archaeon]